MCIWQGCEINWKKGKNVTVKTIKKKQKHKSRGSVRTVTKSVQADSFFNFFSPPAMPEDPNSTLASDIQVGGGAIYNRVCRKNIQLPWLINKFS